VANVPPPAAAVSSICWLPAVRFEMVNEVFGPFSQAFLEKV